MSDNDLQVLKEFRAELDQSEVDGAQARVRRRVVRATEKPAPKRRWIPAVATAAAAAAVLIGTVAVLQPHNTGAPDPNASPPASGQPTPSASPPDPASLPVDLPRADPLPLTAEGLTVGPGQLLYSQQFNGDTHLEQWYEPDGTILIASQSTEPNYVPGPNLIRSQTVDQMKPQADAQRAQYVHDGPSLRLPTRQYLADLPADPASLATQLQAELNLHRHSHLIEDLTDWLVRVEPLLTPRVRAALIAALDLQKDVRVDHKARTFDGRNIYLVDQTNQEGTHGLIVDVATGRIIGAYGGSAYALPSLGMPWRYAVVTR
jgi:hypothetical protein